MVINNIVVISDTHFGCKLALCPNEFKLDEGGIYKASKLQKKLYTMWYNFWNEWVPAATREEDYIIVHNGDIIDGIHHNTVTQISHNITDQSRIAIEMMSTVVNNKKCKGYYQIRGTEAHVGKSGQYEEAIAKQLNAIPNKMGNYARWELWLEFGKYKKLLHFTHHVGTTNSASYESTAVYKELVEAYNEAGRWKKRPPDVVIRSHRHRQFEIKIATEGGYGMSIVTPSWQLKTPFVYKQTLGRATLPQIGGYLIRSGDEDHIYTRFKVFTIDNNNKEKI